MIPKVSVIVPIFNADSYLQQCLDSLMNQTMKEVEFILIDDCSIDNSPTICDEYVACDSRFSVIHRKDNGGSSIARQDGLDVAQGEYIIICDSDDWVESNMYELLYENAKKYNADISTCDYFIEYESKTVISHHEITENNQEHLIRDALTHCIPPASWIKMVKRDFIITNEISYERGINQGEDALIFLKLLLKKPKITKINTPLYHYRRLKNGKSYTNAPTYSSYKQTARIEIWKEAHFNSKQYGKELFHGHIDMSYLGLRVKEMPIEEHKAYMKQKCKWSDFIKYNRFDIKALVIIVSKINRSFGYFLYKRLSWLFYK